MGTLRLSIPEKDEAVGIDISDEADRRQTRAEARARRYEVSGIIPGVSSGPAIRSGEPALDVAERLNAVDMVPYFDDQRAADRQANPPRIS